MGTKRAVRRKAKRRLVVKRAVFGRSRCKPYTKPARRRCPRDLNQMCRDLNYWFGAWRDWGCHVNEELNDHDAAIKALLNAVCRLEGKVFCRRTITQPVLCKCDGTQHPVMDGAGGGPGGPGEPPDEPFGGP